MRLSRTYSVFFFGAVLISIFGFCKPTPIDPRVKTKVLWDRFWAVKVFSHHQYDMVIMGDSRVYRGVSPSEMQLYLQNYRILNFGFSNGGLNSTMFVEAEKRLDPNSEIKTILIGLTPLALMKISEGNDRFLEKTKLSKLDFLLLKRFPEVIEFLDPIVPEHLYRSLFQLPPKRFYFQEFYDDGWVATSIVPEDPDRALKQYKRVYKNKVQQHLIDGLVIQTQKWVKQKIQVYAFRPPTTSKMLTLENEQSGFDEKDFIKRFQDAGGVWITVPTHPFRSYDGSHLTKESARLLSQRVAKQIHTNLSKFSRLLEE